jgi:hypothetical protein
MSVVDRPVFIRISYTKKLSNRAITVKSLSSHSDYRRVNLRNLDGKVSWCLGAISRKNRVLLEKLVPPSSCTPAWTIALSAPIFTNSRTTTTGGFAAVPADCTSLRTRKIRLTEGLGARRRSMGAERGWLRTEGRRFESCRAQRRLGSRGNVVCTDAEDLRGSGHLTGSPKLRAL